MNKSCLRYLTVTVLLLISLMAGPLVSTKTLAQNTSTTTTTQSSPAQGGNSAQTTSTRQTTSTTTTQTVPTQTTTTVDPLWIAAGVIGLLALLAIVLLAMRGRSGDRVATTRESTTVIKKD
jgi:beta-lactamase regulating signal transducer with metallopeptidase domain